MKSQWSLGPDDEEDDDELLELSAGFSILEEEPDNSEALRVLERQWDTLQVQLDNRADSVEAWAQQAPPPPSGPLRQQWAAQRDRLRDQLGRLERRLEELKEQIRTLGGE